MEFFKEVLKNKWLILRMASADFKNKFANTSLGAVWGFISPFVFIMTYVFVFEYILRTGSAGDYPFAVWFLPGIAIWMLMNDSIIHGSNSIRHYSYLVKKVVFPINTIPLISVVSSFIVSILIIVVALVVCLIMGTVPNFLEFFYYIVAAVIFVVAVTRLTSALTALVPDFGQLLPIVMQLLFWFTPVIWNVTMLSGTVFDNLIRLNPLAYIVTGFRDAFIGGSTFSMNGYIYTIVFWILVVLIFIYGNYVFKNAKKQFADVL